MAGYFKRLARQSGLLSGAQAPARAPLETPDIREIHEERTVGATVSPADAAQSSLTAAAIHDARAASPNRAAMRPRDGASGAAAASPIVADAASAPPFSAQRDIGDPAVIASTPKADSVGAGDRLSPGFAQPVPAGSMDSARSAPSADLAGITIASDENSARNSARAEASPAVPSKRRSARPPPAAASLASPPAPPDPEPFNAPGAAAGSAPRLSAIAAEFYRAPPATVSSPAPPSAPRTREVGVKVHIGKINIEIHAPLRPAPAPLITAPAPPAAIPAAAAEPVFSAYRHYLRADR